MMSMKPMTIAVVSGSPMSVKPMAIAVRGSKAPRIATLAESISVSDRTRVTLLTVVGTSPRSMSEKMMPRQEYAVHRLP